LRLRRLDNLDLPPTLAGRWAADRLPPFDELGGYLIGRQGKTRCALAETECFLRGEPSPVTRLELRLLPGPDTPPLRAAGSGRFTVGLHRSEIGTLPQIDRLAARLATRAGVRIWPTTLSLREHAGYRYRPLLDRTAPGGGYTLRQPDATGTAHLVFADRDAVHRFRLRQFQLQRLLHGAKFLADRCPATDDGAPGITTAEDHRRLSGPLLESVRDADAFRLRLAGRLAGEYVLRPVTIDGERRHLFYRCT